MDHVTEIKAACAAGVAVLTALWGWFGWVIVLFVACMVVDYLTGTMAAMYAGSWSSSTACKGILHKLGCIVVVAVAGAADLLLGMMLAHLPGITLPFEYTVLICPVVVIWYILTELGSIIENAVALGAPCPKWLAGVVDAAKDAVEETGSKILPQSEGDEDT
ncbi:phage holin family protein [Agathobaculum sp. Marseille-P7918]|uniref:phage holin family protein n=1 Tax=Agathobaculum sp. Marseille-P7918 TaxID=2479843 RepID=UPI000F641CEB|nr:phage holin family protein [Agathobaculum sp. Marseille-P7918]